MVVQHSPGLYSVLYDFHALETGEVSVHTGQLVEVRGIENKLKYEGWSLVRFALGGASGDTSVVGFVPANYLIKYDSEGYIGNNDDKDTKTLMDEGDEHINAAREKGRDANNFESLDNDAAFGAARFGFLLRGFGMRINASWLF